GDRSVEGDVPSNAPVVWGRPHATGLFPTPLTSHVARVGARRKIRFARRKFPRRYRSPGGRTSVVSGRPAGKRDLPPPLADGGLRNPTRPSEPEPLCTPQEKP